MGSLGWEDLLEQEMVTHTSIPVWKILWTAKIGGYSLWGCKELDMTERAHTHTHTHTYIHTHRQTHTHLPSSIIVKKPCIIKHLLN